MDHPEISNYVLLACAGEREREEPQNTRGLKKGLKEHMAPMNLPNDPSRLSGHV